MRHAARLIGVLRGLATGALVLGTISAWAAPARADACFGSGPPHIRRDAGPTDDGSEVGLLPGSRTRRKAGAGLVLVAGLGGAWLGSRRKGEDGDGGDGPGASLK